MRERTISEVMRNPIVSYIVHAVYPDGDVEDQPFDEEHEAVEAARMLLGGGARNITVERRILRVVEDVENVEWR